MFLRALALFLLSFTLSFNAVAEGEEPYIAYVELKPFTANFGDSSELHYVKCEITIQAGSPETEQAVLAHRASIRNDILFLLMAQSEEEIGSVNAQSILSKKALNLVQQILIEETGEQNVTDLFFVSFVAQ
ncbi:MAG: flagellar basal body-associated FliL family protein [Pseudomonadales bacterium]